MSSRLFSILAAVLSLGLALGGAAAPVPAFEDGPRRSVDDELARMGREIPGFGGLFYDAQGRANVYLLDPEGAGAAVLKNLGPDVRVRRGDYEFERLLGWRSELRPLLALPGAVFLDVDEARNRVAIGLDATSPSKSRDRAELEKRLAATGVPRQAVVVEETAPIALLVGLRDKLRPIPGGVQIAFAPSVCTLGFNAYLGRDFGFVINSHCTGTRGEVDGMRYSQSLPVSGIIGTEIADPGFSTGAPCPLNRRCRFSDSAFAKYAKPRLGGLGKIARPVAGGPEFGSVDLKPKTARFTIAGRGESPFVGDTVHKVGRTTGWTYGTVLRTCADTNNGGTNVTMFCQSVARGGGGPGDSGSPIFSWTGGLNVRLLGILWGGGFDPQNGTVYVFSPLEAIEQELGPLRIN